MENNNPIFIVGIPRSGTTLLSSFLNASKMIYIPEETHYYYLREKFFSKGNMQEFIDYFFSERNPHFNLYNLNADEILKIKKDYLNNKNIVKSFCELKANKYNIKRWGEKTPLHFKYIDELLVDFPNAKIINIIRDPRDVMDSIKKTKWKNNFNIYNQLLHYKMNFNIVQKHKDSTNFINIRYEDLVLNTELTLKNVFDFIDIEFDQKIIDTFYKLESTNFDIKKESWKSNNLKPINSSNVYKWKKNKKSLINSFISWFLAKENKVYGYDYTNSNKINFYLYFTFLYTKHLFTLLLKKILK